MSYDLGPTIVTLIVVLVVLAPIAYIARDTCNKIVAREFRDSTQDTYKRPAPPERVAKQEKARSERLQQAQGAHRIWCWTVSTALTVVAVLAGLYGWSKLDGFVLYAALGVLGVAVVTGVVVVFRHAVTFPDMPERAKYVETPLPADDEGEDTPEGTVTTKHTRATVTRADRDKRARRKKAAASRKKNRR